MSAIAFKAVHGGSISGVQRVTPEVLAAMEEMNDVAPAHNPPYVAAVRAFRHLHPALPCIGTFETAFYDDLPVEKVRGFLVDLRSFVKAQHPDLPKAIRDEKVLSDSNEEILRGDIAEFHKSMAPDESVAPSVA